MKAIIETATKESWDVEFPAVISNNPKADGLIKAKNLGRKTITINQELYSDRYQYECRLASEINKFKPDLIVLAGFMRILSKDFVDQYQGKIINIHPSLLPAFPGLNTHRNALLAGVKVHGITIHFVTSELDAGPIIAQKSIEILENDTEVSLKKRIQKIEHEIYPKVIKQLLNNLKEKKY